MQCEYIFKRGQLEGQQCQVIPKNGPLCCRHSLKRKKYAQQYNQQYEIDNKEQIKGRKKQYYIDNQDQVKANHKQYNTLNWNKKLLRSCKYSDKVYNREFNLDEDWVSKMLYAQYNLCYICGDEMLLINGSKDSKQISINRVDNSKGHIKGNVVLTCWQCNNRQKCKHLSEFHDLDDVLHPETIDELM